MKSLYLKLGLFGLLLITYSQTSAQQVLSSAALPVGYSDNASGTEIINTPAGQSVHFAATGSTGFNAGGSFEHVGQFYVAANGVYDGSFIYTPDNANGRDYFGYAPAGSGSNNGPYLGLGIMGASPNNGGSGAGIPSFGNLILTSTGHFPVVAGAKIWGSLTFGTSGGSGSSIITVPDGQEIKFIQFCVTYGANDANYINGRVSCSPFLQGTAMFPVGDPQNTAHPYHPMTTSGMSAGTAARYLNANPLPVEPAYFWPGIGAVSTIGYWKIDGLSTFSGVSVSIPQPSGLGTNPNPANLRLVGWTGSKWVLLSNAGAVAPTGGSGSDLNGYILSGGMPNHVSYSISALGIATIEGAAPLPVRLISFTGRYIEGTGTNLDWQTSFETNNDYFDIQRSGDAKSFESIGRIAGTGTTKALTDYRFVDTFVPTNVTYYRLKQVDTDGSQHFSQIISVRQGIDNVPVELILSPNPVQNSMNLRLSAGHQIKEASVYDLQGIQLQQATTSEFKISSLPVGSYVLRVTTTTGQNLEKRFIKQ